MHILLGEFNTLNMMEGEKGESLINRMTKLKMNLAAYNNKINDNPELLGRIKSILEDHPIYSSLIAALDASTNPATWEKACELTIKKDTNNNFKKSATALVASSSNIINHLKVDSKFHCPFHQTNSHDTSDCKAVDDLIKAARDEFK